MERESMDYNQTLLTEDDLYLFNEGSHFHLYEKIGAHTTTVNSEEASEDWGRYS